MSFVKYIKDIQLDQSKALTPTRSPKKLFCSESRTTIRPGIFNIFPTNYCLASMVHSKCREEFYQYRENGANLGKVFKIMFILPSNDYIQGSVQKIKRRGDKTCLG